MGFWKAGGGRKHAREGIAHGESLQMGDPPKKYIKASHIWDNPKSALIQIITSSFGFCALFLRGPLSSRLDPERAKRTAAGRVRQEVGQGSHLPHCRLPRPSQARKGHVCVFVCVSVFVCMELWGAGSGKDVKHMSE